jgi:hypothetical protein
VNVVASVRTTYVHFCAAHPISHSGTPASVVIAAFTAASTGMGNGDVHSMQLFGAFSDLFFDLLASS